MVTNDRPNYKLNDWKEYLENCRGLRKVIRESIDHYNYIKSMEKIRELTSSEFYFVQAYDEEILGVR